MEYPRIETKIITFGEMLNKTLTFIDEPNWSVEIMSEFIESILLRVPISKFYVKELSYDNWQVVDGAQRLHTIKKFVNDEFELTNLQILKHFENLKFSDFEKSDTWILFGTFLDFTIIQKSTDKQICEILVNRLRRKHL